MIKEKLQYILTQVCETSHQVQADLTINSIVNDRPIRAVFRIDPTKIQISSEEKQDVLFIDRIIFDEVYLDSVIVERG